MQQKTSTCASPHCAKASLNASTGRKSSLPLFINVHHAPRPGAWDLLAAGNLWPPVAALTMYPVLIHRMGLTVIGGAAAQSVTEELPFSATFWSNGELQLQESTL